MKYLHLVSSFPALTETFVLREVRQMQQIGCDVVLGQLRPTGDRPTAPEFEDLRPWVVQAKLLGLSALAGALFFLFKKPKLTWRYIKLVLASFPDMTSLFKLGYLLLVSMDLAYRLRHSSVEHTRGHHLHSEAVSAMFIAGFLGLPYSFTCHTVKTYYPPSILVEVARGAAFVVADTFQTRDFLTDLCGDARRVHLIRNAVVLSEFPMRDQKAPSEPPTILAVGRLDQKKGFHILLSACSELNREGVPFHCVIVGDGDEWESLHELKKLLGINEKVQMVGNRDFSEIQLWYEQATLLVVPSVVAADGSTDGLPTVVIEAFARGAPVIGSSTAGIPEVIRHGVNGFVVPAGVSSELASRIKELLSNEDLCRLFATQARFTAELDFDLDRNVQALARLMIGEVLERTVISRSMAISSPSLEHKHTT